MTTLLSPLFSLEELSITQVRGVDNTPSAAIIENLRLLAGKLEEIRAILRKPILVNSGYRSPAVNVAVGGVPHSAHMLGYAADFICPGFGTPLEICQTIAESGIKFDQIIEEGTWVHISVDPKQRGEVMTKNPEGGYRFGLPVVG